MFFIWKSSPKYTRQVELGGLIKKFAMAVLLSILYIDNVCSSEWSSYKATLYINYLPDFLMHIQRKTGKVISYISIAIVVLLFVMPTFNLLTVLSINRCISARRIFMSKAIKDDANLYGSLSLCDKNSDVYRPTTTSASSSGSSIASRCAAEKSPHLRPPRQK